MLNTIRNFITPYIRVPNTKKNRAIVARYTKHIYGPTYIPLKSNEITVVCLVQNGEIFIESFISHYRKLGVKHIFFMLNNSSDNTIYHLRKYKNVSVFINNLPYRKYAWCLKPYLISHFAKNKWCICADIDEFIDYPFSNGIKLKKLLEYLNKKSYNSVTSQMLDMFSKQTLSKQLNKQYIFRKNNFKYFDLTNIRKTRLPGKNIISNKNIKFHKGGIRARIFGLNDLYLTKFSIIRLADQSQIDNFGTHIISKNAKIADFSCVIYHYKLIPTLYLQCKKAISDNNYFDNSIQYKKYFQKFQKSNDLNIFNLANKPMIIKNTNDLVNMKFLEVSTDFINLSKQ
jgi:hypothetical protein